MKKLMLLVAVLCALSVLAPQAQAKPEPGAKYDYILKDVFPVAGRQGVTCDGKYIYVSCSKALYKYDMKGKLVASNKNPFEGYAIPSNHIGDIDVYNGELYVGAEVFVDGVGKDIQIAVHDAVRKVHLQPVPQWVQGVFYYKGSLYMTADDGTADLNEPDHLYRIDITSATNAHVYLEKCFDEAIRQGEIEGLCVDPSTGDLLVHMNRGAQIVLGMTKGLYPGYKEEIHEIYRYEMIPAKKGPKPPLPPMPAPKPAK